MANPVLSDRIFKKEAATAYSSTMSMRGTVVKSAILALMVLAGASYSWKVYNEALVASSVNGWMWGGAIGGFIIAMIISFRPNLAQYLAPIYAVLEGLFLGGISAIYNELFIESAPGIITNAILLTIGTAFVMFALYRGKIIKVDKKFRQIIVTAIGAIAFYYIISIVLSLFGLNLTLLHDSGPLSIIISLVIVVVAAMTLLIDFDFIERASAEGAPKYMEWYGAFALMVTLVWLYLEILKLLAKFAGNRK